MKKIIYTILAMTLCSYLGLDAASASSAPSGAYADAGSAKSAEFECPSFMRTLVIYDMLQFHITFPYDLRKLSLAERTVKALYDEYKEISKHKGNLSECKLAQLSDIEEEMVFKTLKPFFNHEKFTFSGITHYVLHSDEINNKSYDILKICHKSQLMVLLFNSRIFIKSFNGDLVRSFPFSHNKFSINIIDDPKGQNIYVSVDSCTYSYDLFGNLVKTHVPGGSRLLWNHGSFGPLEPR